jgi:hypothetical protein
VRTVMSSSWPKRCAASAMTCAECRLISRVRSKPKSSPVAFFRLVNAIGEEGECIARREHQLDSAYCESVVMASGSQSRQ